MFVYFSISNLHEPQREAKSTQTHFRRRVQAVEVVERSVRHLADCEPVLLRNREIGVNVP